MVLYYRKEGHPCNFGTCVGIGKSLVGSSTIKSPLYHHLCLKEGRVAGGRKGQSNIIHYHNFHSWFHFSSLNVKPVPVLLWNKNSAVLMQLGLKQVEVQATGLSQVFFQMDWAEEQLWVGVST